jgi:hypothetical protein
VRKHRHIILAGFIVLLASIADKSGFHAIAMVVMGCLVGYFAAQLDKRRA